MEGAKGSTAAAAAVVVVVGSLNKSARRASISGAQSSGEVDGAVALGSGAVALGSGAVALGGGEATFL